MEHVGSRTQKTYTAYTWFCKGVFQEIRKKYKEASFAVISKMSSAMWKNLSVSEKKFYKKKAKSQDASSPIINDNLKSVKQMLMELVPEEDGELEEGEFHPGEVTEVDEEDMEVVEVKVYPGEITDMGEVEETVIDKDNEDESRMEIGVGCDSEESNEQGLIEDGTGEVSQSQSPAPSAPFPITLIKVDRSPNEGDSESRKTFQSENTDGNLKNSVKVIYTCTPVKPLVTTKSKITDNERAEKMSEQETSVRTGKNSVSSPNRVSAPPPRTYGKNDSNPVIQMGPVSQKFHELPESSPSLPNSYKPVEKLSGQGLQEIIVSPHPGRLVVNAPKPMKHTQRVMVQENEIESTQQQAKIVTQPSSTQGQMIVQPKTQGQIFFQPSTSQGLMTVQAPSQGLMSVQTPSQGQMVRVQALQGQMGAQAPSKGQMGVQAPSQGQIVVQTPSQGQMMVQTLSQGQMVVQAPSQGQMVVQAPSQGQMVVQAPSQGQILLQPSLAQGQIIIPQNKQFGQVLLQNAPQQILFQPKVPLASSISQLKTTSTQPLGQTVLQLSSGSSPSILNPGIGTGQTVINLKPLFMHANGSLAQTITQSPVVNATTGESNLKKQNVSKQSTSCQTPLEITGQGKAALKDHLLRQTLSELPAKQTVTQPMMSTAQIVPQLAAPIGSHIRLVNVNGQTQNFLPGTRIHVISPQQFAALKSGTSQPLQFATPSPQQTQHMPGTTKKPVVLLGPVPPPAAPRVTSANLLPVTSTSNSIPKLIPPVFVKGNRNSKVSLLKTEPDLRSPSPPLLKSVSPISSLKSEDSILNSPPVLVRQEAPTLSVSSSESKFHHNTHLSIQGNRIRSTCRSSSEERDSPPPSSVLSFKAPDKPEMRIAFKPKRKPAEKKKAPVNPSQETPIYTCNFCMIAFTKVGDLKAHFLSKHADDDVDETDSMPFECFFCAEKYPNRDLLVKHMQRIHEQPKPKEAPPPAVNHSQTDLSKVPETSQTTTAAPVKRVKKPIIPDKYPSLCTCCGMELPSKRELCIHKLKKHVEIFNPSLHMSVEHSETVSVNVDDESGNSTVVNQDVVHKTSFCLSCGYPSKSNIDLGQHINTAHMGKYPCPGTDCNKVFQQRRCLKYHIISAHPKFRAYSCKFCSYCTYHQLTILRHLKQHNQLQKLLDAEEKSSVSSSMTSKSTPKESPEPYVYVEGLNGEEVPQTPFKKTSRKQQISSPPTSPSSSSPPRKKKKTSKGFPCLDCQKVYDSRESLTQHFATCSSNPHASSQMSTCNMCFASFENALELKNHRKRAHFRPAALNKLSCLSCDIAFTDEEQLKAHKESHFNCK